MNYLRRENVLVLKKKKNVLHFVLKYRKYSITFYSRIFSTIIYFMSELGTKFFARLVYKYHDISLPDVYNDFT